MNGKPVFTVPAKTVINFKSKFKEKLLCDGSTFSAGSACPYSCSFCYVPSQMLKQTPWLASKGVSGRHEDIVIRRDNAVEIVRQQLLSHSKAERQKKKVIYASPLTDVAANMDLVRETVEICKVIIKLTNWDIRLLSKSNLLPKVAQALAAADTGCSTSDFGHHGTAARIIYGVSTGTLDDKLAATFEQGTPKVSKRIESLHWLQDNGYRTFAMVCPSLPQNDYVKFAAEMRDTLRYDRCEHVWTEVINLRGESFTNTVACLRSDGFNDEAARLEIVQDKQAWEEYSRATFCAHAAVVPSGKLRFLQYVNDYNRDWWTPQVQNGAVLL